MASKKSSYSKNSFNIKTSKDDKVKVDGRFVFKSLTCRITGGWDITRNIPEHSRFILSASGKTIVDQVVSFGTASVSTHCKFGSTVTGIDELLLVAERSRDATFVSGIADKKQLIPMRFEGLPCSCSDSVDQNLTYADKDRIKILDFSLTNKRISADAEGLAQTIEKTTTAYRIGRQPIIDDITDIVIGVYCWLKCFIQFLSCLGRLPQHACQQLFLFCNASCRVVNRPIVTF